MSNGSYPANAAKHENTVNTREEKRFPWTSDTLTARKGVARDTRDR